MAANYLHGVETLEVEKGARPVSMVKSAVIGLVGTAPAGDVNTLVQCPLSEKDAAAFGSTVYRLYHSAGAGCDLRPWCELFWSSMSLTQR